MSWFVYILFCDQKTFYVGVTNNLEERLREHIRGYSQYTKKFSDIRLVYSEQHFSRIQAENRERQLKGWSAAKKKALINRDKDLLRNLSKSHEVVDGGGIK